MRNFADLVAEAEAAPMDDWDFSWLDGRATEERPPWGYQRAMGERLARASTGLDVQTGGGEVLAGAPALPPLMVATESWPPNVARATALLHPRGAAVVVDPDEPPLPFGDAAFDLVTSRHPVTAWWEEIARVLRPGGPLDEFPRVRGTPWRFHAREIATMFLSPEIRGTASAPGREFRDALSLIELPGPDGRVTDAAPRAIDAGSTAREHLGGCQQRMDGR